MGAFYQPQMVLADPHTLTTLGRRELSEGWAEAIKHGFIMDADLVSVFEDHASELMGLEPELSTEVIRRSMAIKADVVSQDERETLGKRVLLNYGHTIGHAIEATTGIRRVDARRGGVGGDDGGGRVEPADGEDRRGRGETSGRAFAACLICP